MTLYPLELEANIIQLITVVIMTTWFVIRNGGKNDLTTKLFIMGLISNVLMNVYWTSMILVDGSGDYATFTANDTATISFLLFWTSMFTTKNRVLNKDNRLKQSTQRKLIDPEAFRGIMPNIMILFGIWNFIWWQAWSPNTMINIIWAIPYTMLLYMIFYTLKKNHALKRIHIILWCALFLILAIFEVPMYFYERGTLIYTLSDWICVGAWAVMSVMFLVSAFVDKRHRTNWLFAAKLFSAYSQYLTDGIRYSGFLLLDTVTLLLLIIFFEAGDLRSEEVVS